MAIKTDRPAQAVETRVTIGKVAQFLFFVISIPASIILSHTMLVSTVLSMTGVSIVLWFIATALFLQQRWQKGPSRLETWYLSAILTTNLLYAALVIEAVLYNGWDAELHLLTLRHAVTQTLILLYALVIDHNMFAGRKS